MGWLQENIAWQTFLNRFPMKLFHWNHLLGIGVFVQRFVWQWSDRPGAPLGLREGGERGATLLVNAAGFSKLGESGVGDNSALSGMGQE